MKNLNSIYPSNNGKLPIVRRSVYGIGALIILINAALIYVDPAIVVSVSESNHSTESLTEVFDQTSLPILQLEEDTSEIRASNCTYPSCNCTPENHCGCLDPNTSESCHTGHGNSSHQESGHNQSHAEHSDNGNGHHICGCVQDTNAQGPATANNTLSKNWIIERQIIDFQLKSLFVLSLVNNLKATPHPYEIFHPPT